MTQPRYVSLFPEGYELELCFYDEVPASRRLSAVTGDLILGEDGRKYPLRDLPWYIKKYWGRPRLGDVAVTWPAPCTLDGPEQVEINDAFGWSATPQGDRFWNVLDNVVYITLYKINDESEDTNSSS